MTPDNASGTKAKYRFSYIIAALCVLLTGSLLFGKITPDQVMNEDFAVYLQETLYLAHGTTFGDMGVDYAVDPDAPLRDQAPLAYPVLVPLLFVPITDVYGLNFADLKYFQFGLLLFSFGLFVAFSRLMGFHPFAAALSVVAFAAFPSIGHNANSLGSDLPFLPFLPFLVSAIISIEMQLQARTEHKLLWAVITGLMIFLAFDARTVGVALLPAAAWTQLVRRRSRPDIVALAVPGITFVALWLFQNHWFGNAGGYGYVLQHRFFDVAANAKQFYWDLARPWSDGPFHRLGLAILLVSFALSAASVAEGFFRGQAAAAFVVAYLALLLILPSFDAGLRYLLPILLFWGAFTARGATLLLSTVAKRRQGLFAIAIVPVMLLGLPTMASYKDDSPPGVLSGTAPDLFNFLRTQTAADSIVAVRKYRAVHLLAVRRTVHPPLAALVSMQTLQRWFTKERVDYAVVKKSPAISKYDYSDCPEHPLCRTGTPGSVARVYENTDYVVFRLIRKQ